MSFQNVDFEFKETAGHQSNSETVAGEGGNILPFWTKGRENIMRNFLGGSGSLTNNSSFDIPSGFVETTSDSWKRTFPDSEKFHGSAVTGIVLDAQGSTLSGDAVIYDSASGDVIGESSSKGLFSVTSIPPSGVYQGQNSQQSGYEFQYIPSISGINYVNSNLTGVNDLGTIQYGEVNGTVLSYQGQPKSGVTVFGSGQAARTNPQGNYSIAAPGGDTVELNAIGTTQDITPSGGESITVDFQYSKIEVTVLTPDLQPVKGVNVRVGQNDYKTNEEGIVEVEDASITQYDIIVSGNIRRSVNVNAQGSLFQEEVGGGSGDIGAEIRVIDSETEERVARVPCEMPLSGVRGDSGNDGVARVFSESENEQLVTVADGDPRYSRVELAIDLSAGEVADERVVLERDKGGSNY